MRRDNLYYITPLHRPAVCFHIFPKAGANMVPTAKAPAQGSIAVPAEAAIFRDCGHAAKFSYNGGPVAEEIGQLHSLGLLRRLQAAKAQGAAKPAEMPPDVIESDAGHLNDFNPGGGALQLAGTLLDGGQN